MQHDAIPKYLHNFQPDKEYNRGQQKSNTIIKEHIVKSIRTKRTYGKKHTTWIKCLALSLSASAQNR